MKEQKAAKVNVTQYALPFNIPYADFKPLLDEI